MIKKQLQEQQQQERQQQTTNEKGHELFIAFVAGQIHVAPFVATLRHDIASASPSLEDLVH